MKAIALVVVGTILAIQLVLSVAATALVLGLVYTFIRESVKLVWYRR